MEPRIQYAKTSDGVSTAFWTLGEGGRPLLMTSPLVFSNISLEWQIPELRQWYERLAANRTVVRYDGRNLGMSERGAPLDSLDDFLLDWECVASRAGLETFDLVGLDGPWQVNHLRDTASRARISPRALGNPRPQPRSIHRRTRGCHTFIGRTGLGDGHRGARPYSPRLVAGAVRTH